MNTQPEQPARKTNVLAKTSFNCGIGGIFTLVFGVLFVIASGASESMAGLFSIFAFIASIFGLIGLVSGALAILQIKKKAGRERGYAIALVGIILGILECLPLLLLVQWFIS